MFTGLIEEIGKIERVEKIGSDIRLRIACGGILEDMETGASIAVDGCCLTVERIDNKGFTAYASPETMSKTSLGERTPGEEVNLERAMTLGSRLGGHLVAGHVDATGDFVSSRKVEKAWEVRISAPPSIINLSVPKGSIAIDGISLTIVDLTETEFSAWIIPETWERTTLSGKKPGQKVNLESDLIGKYVYRFLEARFSGSEASDERIRGLLEQGGWGNR